MAYDYEYFKKEILALTTIDLNSYKEKQMKRRIDTLIAKHKIVGYDKYVQALRTIRLCLRSLSITLPLMYLNFIEILISGRYWMRPFFQS